MKRYGSVLLGCLFLLTLLSPVASEVMRRDYEGFTIWLDCDKRGAVKFRYNAQRDQGEFQRHSITLVKAPKKKHISLILLDLCLRKTKMISYLFSIT
jgi:hypothetical protein